MSDYTLLRKNLKKIKSEKELDGLWKGSEALVVDFSAAWCGPCKALEPLLDRLEREHPSIVFAKVNVDRFVRLTDKNDVQAMPTICLVRKGKEVHRCVGLHDRAALKRMIESHLLRVKHKG